jgi:hypothetical protein
MSIVVDYRHLLLPIVECYLLNVIFIDHGIVVYSRLLSTVV